jgi:NAD+ kinase
VGRLSAGALDDIAETLGEHRIASAQDTSTNADSIVEPKKGSGEDTALGQEDEQTWRNRLEAKDQEATNGDSKVEVQQQTEPNGVHSRLLTKKQLSDMAWGVRELSKRLGSIRLKLKVKTVFLLTKAHDETLIGNTREVAKWLLSPDRQVRYTVWVENTLKENKKFDAKGLLAEVEKDYAQKNADRNGDKKLEKRLRYWNNEMCRTRPHTFDFVVTLGGDGTVLYASWLFQRIVPPVLSFALGSLGFLTKFDYDEFEDTLTKSFRDGVTISLRLRFEGTVMRSQKRKGSALKEGESELKEGESELEDREIDLSRDLVEELVGEEKEDERTHQPDGTYEILNDIVVDRGPNPSQYSTFQYI